MISVMKTSERSFHDALIKACPWASPKMLVELDDVFATSAGTVPEPILALRRTACRDLVKSGTGAMRRWSQALSTAASLIGKNQRRRRLWRFMAALDVRGSEFTGRFAVDLADVVFPGEVIFADAKILGDGFFNAARFGGPADFSGVRFDREGNFENCAFADVADFSGTVWAGSARFRQASFARDCTFAKAAFLKDAWFRGGTFRGAVTFADASWVGEAGLGSVTYAGAADFQRARFEDNAGFDSAQFLGPARFEGARFARTAWFDKSRFNDAATFDLARFLGRVNFEGVNIADPRRPVPAMIETIRRRMNEGTLH